MVKYKVAGHCEFKGGAHPYITPSMWKKLASPFPKITFLRSGKSSENELE